MIGRARRESPIAPPSRIRPGGGDRGQEEERLELRVLPDRRLDGGQPGAPGLGIESGREERDRAGQQRAAGDRIDEQVGQECGQGSALHRAMVAPSSALNDPLETGG